MKKTIREMYEQRERQGVPVFQAGYCAFGERLGLSAVTWEECEAKIARWEALEEACVQGGPQMVEVMRALRAEISGPRTGVEIAAAQALQPVINAGLAGAPAQCGCGGPAGHVPNGVWCRKGC